MSRPEATGIARAQTPAQILDLSQKGALMVLAGALDVGAIHDFLIDLGGDHLWVQGEVRRCLASTKSPGFEIGVEFVGIDPQDETRLASFLASKGR